MLKLKWRGYPMQVTCLYSFDGYFVSASAGLCLWCYIMLFDNLQVNYVYWVYTHTHIKVMHLMCLVLNPRPQPPPRTCKVKRCRKKKITSFMYFSICIINIYMLDCWPVGYLWKEVFLQAFNISKQFLHWHRVHMDKINLRIYFLIHCI